MECAALANQPARGCSTAEADSNGLGVIASVYVSVSDSGK